MKKKVNHLVKLNEAMQEELKTDHIKNKSKKQILSLVPDKWSQMYC